MWKISLPLRVDISKNRQFSLNLNQFRNTHFQALNKAKTNFERDIIRKLRGIPKLRTVTLEYIVWAPNRQLFDTNNICSIVDKFFSDTLVAAGIIEDDNYTIVVDSRFRPGGIDKGNPRVDCIIRCPDLEVPPEPIKEERRIKMQIKTVVVLSEDDVQKALTDYLGSQVSIPKGAKMTTSTVADGLEITITSGLTPVAATKQPKPAPVAKVETVEPVAEVKPEEPTPEPEPTAAAAEEPPKPKGPSLFSGLKKPTNA